MHGRASQIRSVRCLSPPGLRRRSSQHRKPLQVGCCPCISLVTAHIPIMTHIKEKARQNKTIQCAKVIALFSLPHLPFCKYHRSTEQDKTSVVPGLQTAVQHASCFVHAGQCFVCTGQCSSKQGVQQELCVHSPLICQASAQTHTNSAHPFAHEFVPF